MYVADVFDIIQCRYRGFSKNNKHVDQSPLELCISWYKGDNWTKYEYLYKYSLGIYLLLSYLILDDTISGTQDSRQIAGYVMLCPWGSYPDWALTLTTIHYSQGNFGGCFSASSFFIIINIVFALFKIQLLMERTKWPTSFGILQFKNHYLRAYRI